MVKSPQNNTAKLKEENKVMQNSLHRQMYLTDWDDTAWKRTEKQPEERKLRTQMYEIANQVATGKRFVLLSHATKTRRHSMRLPFTGFKETNPGVPFAQIVGSIAEATGIKCSKGLGKSNRPNRRYQT